ncbi:MAG TPA: amidohydrolase family protein [Gemmatimonadales bacterium]|nr:amidohydrolase family protein [Gemmatimonadales bacterium]
MPAIRLAATWVVPMTAPPIRDGAVLVGEDGRVVAIGPHDVVPTPPGVPRARFHDAVLLPGLVNAHTHLELTGLAGAVTEAAFPDWIRRLRAVKAERTPADFLAAATQGIRDCWAAGVTTVADTGDSGAVIEALAALGARGIAYHEVFGPHPAQCDESLAGLAARVAELGRFTSAHVRLGVSPHAPYTVSRPLYRAVAGWARGAGLPLAVHLAESPEESALVGAGGGPFAAMWRRREIPVHEGQGASPVAWVADEGVLGADVLCIHVVHASDEDLRVLASHGVGIAHCPLSNRAHAHGTAPLAAMRRHGLRVGVGTDSVVSVGALDLLAEARAARALGALDAVDALALATLDAARAIGLGAEVGTLAPGRWGDVAVFDLQGNADPVEAALGAPPAARATFVAGRMVHQREVA